MKCHKRTRLSVERLEDRTVPSLAFGSAFGFGSTAYDSVQAVATDAAGNVYAAGEFAGTVDLDPSAGQALLTSVGASSNTFVAKYGPNPATGQFDLLWAKRMGNRGDASNATNTDVTVDGSGNVFVTDLFEGTADFGNVTLSSGGLMDAFVAKLDQDGTVQWARQMGNGSGTEYEHGQGVAVDAAGNVYTTGRLSRANSPSETGAFVIKHDANGQLAWLKMMTVTPDGIANAYATIGQAIRVDAAGNVLVTGVYSGTVDFDPGSGNYNLTSSTIPSAQSYRTDVFVLKLDESGSFVWAGGMGSQGNDNGADLAVDASGAVYVAGRFDVSTTLANDFDPGPATLTLPNAGYTDIFVVKLDANRNLQWARSLGGPVGSDGAWGITLDAAGNVYTTGSFSGIADFDPGSGTFNLTSAGATDVHISELSNAGDFVWAGCIVAASGPFDVGYELAVDGSGNVYTGGVFGGQADFDPGPGISNLTSANDATGAPSSDAFLSKLFPAVPSPSRHRLPVVHNSRRGRHPHRHRPGYRRRHAHRLCRHGPLQQQRPPSGPAGRLHLHGCGSGGACVQRNI